MMRGEDGSRNGKLDVSKEGGGKRMPITRGHRRGVSKEGGAERI